MRFTMKAILVAASVVLAAAASAQPRPGGRPGGGGGGGGGGPPGGGAPGGMIAKIQAEQIAQLFTAAGFRSKVIDNNNTRMVQSEFWGADVFAGAIPEACAKDGSGCGAFKIFANLGTDSGVDDAWVAAWNNTWLYVRAIKLDNGALVFAWDVALLTGVTPDYIKASAQLFKAIVDASSDFKPQ